MAIERKWLAVQATPLTADGTSLGVVKVQDTAGFRTKQLVFLLSNSVQPLQVQVQEVKDNTTLVVGPVSPKVGREYFTDISAYLVADNATIAAPEQEKKANPPEKDHYNAIYESDPVVADRVILVDQYGKLFGDGNPLPIAFDGTVNVGNVTIQDDDGNELEVNQDGSINVSIVQTGSDGLGDLSYQYGEASAVPSGVETTVLTVVVPSGQKRIQKIEFSGSNVAEVRIKRNGVMVSKKRIWHGNFNATFDFEQFINGIKLLAGETLTVTALHNRPDVGDFEATAWFL